MATRQPTNSMHTRPRGTRHADWQTGWRTGMQNSQGCKDNSGRTSTCMGCSWGDRLHCDDIATAGAQTNCPFVMLKSNTDETNCITPWQIARLSALHVTCTTRSATGCHMASCRMISVNTKATKVSKNFNFRSCCRSCCGPWHTGARYGRTMSHRCCLFT